MRDCFELLAKMIIHERKTHISLSFQRILTSQKANSLQIYHIPVTHEKPTNPKRNPFFSMARSSLFNLSLALNQWKGFDGRKTQWRFMDVQGS